MAGKSSSERAALERQNAAVMAVFERAGFDQIAPDIIQPADIFLERSGEDIRARTFVFTDPRGTELCLRPDLTVPACRYHLSHGAGGREARYCYLGPAFRFPDEALSPQEFTQAGIEWFGDTEGAAAEARILKLAVSALEAAGLSKLTVTLGDLGLFAALLEDVDMPQRWRRRLRHQFWRPQAFRDLLESYTLGNRGKRSSISATIDALEHEDAPVLVQRLLSAQGLPLVGGRSVEDIAQRLSGKFADRSEYPLPHTISDSISHYLALKGTASEVVKDLRAMASGARFAAAVTRYEQRLEAMEDQGLNPRRFRFEATFGRELEYYTGFVFQVEAPHGKAALAVAGGGRYDDLLEDMGAEKKVPAVGCAIHTNRLLAVLS